VARDNDFTIQIRWNGHFSPVGYSHLATPQSRDIYLAQQARLHRPATQLGAAPHADRQGEDVGCVASTVREIGAA
jgi:hypothetical protein